MKARTGRSWRTPSPGATTPRTSIDIQAPLIADGWNSPARLAFSRASRSHRGRAHRGEPGIGKSRLPPIHSASDVGRGRRAQRRAAGPSLDVLAREPAQLRGLIEPLLVELRTDRTTRSGDEASRQAADLASPTPTWLRRPRAVLPSSARPAPSDSKSGSGRCSSWCTTSSRRSRASATLYVLEDLHFAIPLRSILWLSPLELACAILLLLAQRAGPGYPSHDRCGRTSASCPRAALREEAAGSSTRRSTGCPTSFATNRRASGW